jgi:hypothetical protein
MARSIVRRAHLRPLGVAALAVVLVSAAVGTSAGTDAAARGAAVAPGATRAPADFRSRVLSTYDQILAAVAAHPAPGKAAPLGRKEFARRINSMPAGQLDALYRATPGVWQQISEAVGKLPDPADPKFRPRPTTRAKGSYHPASVPPPQGDWPARPPVPDVITAPVLPEALPVIPCPPTTLVAAVLTAKLALEEAVAAIEIKEAGLPKIQIAVVAGEGTAVPDLAEGALAIVAAALEALVAGDEYIFENLENCYIGIFLAEDLAVEDDAEAIGEDNQVLTEGLNDILGAESTMTEQLDAGYAATVDKQSHLQTSLNTAQASLDEQLKLRIQTALAEGRPQAAFQLPASAGGYLDATPIGVAQIVTEALARLRAVGEPIDSAAPRDLTLANNALKAKRYKLAYHYYELAYRAMAN